MSYTELFFDSNRGIYIPRDFAEMIDPQDWNGIDPQDLQTLRNGPDDESYWDSWQSVLDYAETKDGRILHQDGDLWLVARDKAGQDLKEFLENCLEYETKHGDAGNNYAYLVEDIDLEDIKRQLAEETMVKAQDGSGDSLGYKWVKKLDLDLRGLDLETVIDLALNCFEMVPGSIFGPFEDGLVLAGFPVQEIEIEIPEAFDDIALDFVRESCEAYISDGTRLAYIATDAVWYAVASVKDLQDAIDSEANA